MHAAARPIPVVVTQFVEEAASLRNTRSVLVKAPHVRIDHLRRLDNRLAAHLDGLYITGEAAWQLCLAALESPSASRLFVAMTHAVRAGYTDSVWRLLALAEALPDQSGGLISGIGWLSPQYLRNIVAKMISSPDSFKRAVGVAACALHRVDPGLSSRNLLEDRDCEVRSRSFRAAAELGHGEALDRCCAALSEEHPECRFWSAWSAVLLGDRDRALASIRSTAVDSGSPPKCRVRALHLALQAMSNTESHALLAELRSHGADVRQVISGSGIAGDPTYVPWLIARMNDNPTARIAAESFSLITGADVTWSDLERPRPETLASSPTDDPEDSNVSIDPDDDLPWPDVEKVEKWWAANESSFQKGARYFMGKLVTREHCIDVLKNGYQRQRILAAHYLCLLEPGTPLFNTSAPAWRQQRLLATM